MLVHFGKVEHQPIEVNVFFNFNVVLTEGLFVPNQLPYEYRLLFDCFMQISKSKGGQNTVVLLFILSLL